MQTLAAKAALNLQNVRKQTPLVHNITNYVVMNYTANALLCMGASPVMAHAPNEVAEMVSLAGALVLNIGTLSDDWIESMIIAGKKAAALGTPVILDPVGAGATRLRTTAARRILAETDVHVLRGNASEILSLQDDDSKTKGVDSMHSVDEAAHTATDLAARLGTTLAITGAVDLVTDGNRTVRVFNGHPLMGVVTGTGCAATAVIGAFLAVDEDPLEATATALAYFGHAGENAGRQSDAPGTFMIRMLDALYAMSPEELATKCRIDSS